MSDEIQTDDDGVKTIANNSEVLFIYDARMCNPNGDPDDENKPRMDYNRSINLVSDLRLKRYLRDYFMDYKKDKEGKPLSVFVSKIEGVTVNAKTGLATMLSMENEAKKIKISDEKVKEFLDKAVDVRMFGAIIPDVTFKMRKGNVTFTGPIQFNWGYSLNKVTGPMESSGITSTFEGKVKEYSTMGKDYRVDYSIIAFHGIISAKRAEHTNLTDEDINLFDDAMIHAIPLEATTRSKKGQCPLLYTRVEYKKADFFLCDLRRYVKITDKDGNVMSFDATAKLRSPDDYKLDLTKLSEKLGKQHDKIQKIHYWKHEDLEVKGWEINNGKLKTKDVEIPVVQLPLKRREN